MKVEETGIQRDQNLRRRSDHHQDHEIDYRIVVPVTLFCVVIVVLILTVWFYRRKRIQHGQIRRRRILTASSPSVYVIPEEISDQIRSPEDVMRRYQRSASYNSQVYLVPFSALPPDFDFASRDVDVKADYVVLKDLKALETSQQRDSSPDVNHCYQPQVSYYSDGTLTTTSVVYRQQAPYNPNFCG
ncbi:uncharacterized protein LOC132706669 [Cylas formicarius]|uniref:uncharacterized protein LOC132706669 n=1 Tax=Cylas formicarius TaxID=197179 RepID=UPI002958964A|nr:uncharacterized protein LOC132706669 [Cylas formicarius]